MFTTRGQEFLKHIFEGLDEMKVTAYLRTGAGRHEIEGIVNKLEDARDDERPALMGSLNRLCREYETDIGLLGESKEMFLKSFPEKNEILDSLTAYYYDISRTAPTPRDYIARLTNNLIGIGNFPEFKDADPGEPIRLKILKRYIAGSPRDWKSYDLLYFYRLAAERTKDEDVADLSPVAVARCMDDSVFDILNKTEIKLSEMVGLIVRQADNLLERKKNEPETNQSVFSDITVSEDTREFLMRFCGDHGVDADTDSIYSLLVALEKRLSEDTDTADALDLYGNTMTGKLDEEFRDTLKKVKYTDSTGRLNPAGKLWKYKKRDFINAAGKAALTEDAVRAVPLLQHCSSIADGNFCRNSRKNREALYVYAIMFGMTCDLGIRDVRKNETDISKNLFEDFYCDNMARFLTNGADTSKMETEPDGAAINYKNFIDMIYVYYLINGKDELPGTRTDKALAAVRECIRKASKETRQPADTGDPFRDELLNDKDATYRYRTQISGIVVNCHEEELTDTIVRYFSIPKSLTSQNIPRVIFSETAMRDFEEIMQDIEDSSEENYLYSAVSSYYEAKGLRWQIPEEVRKGNKTVSNVISAEKQRWYIQRQRFNRQFLDMLNKRYPEDKAFLKMTKAISDRIEEFNGVTLKNKLREAALRNLYFAPGPVLSENLTREIGCCIGAEISGETTAAIIDDLIELGFDIECSTEAMRKKAGTLYGGPRHKRSYTVNVMDHPPAADITKPIAEQIFRPTGTFYQLHSRSYPDAPLLREIMDSMPSYYSHDEHDADRKVIGLLRSAGRKNRTVTRSRLLAAVANRYMYGDTELPALLYYGHDDADDMYFLEDLKKPSDVFAVFEAGADDILIESGFQELNPKNIFDMYLFLSILVYFMYNEADR